MRLLRSGNAPLILSFLHAENKRRPRAAIRHEELQEQLENYLIELRRDNPDAYPATAQAYLANRYLRKYFESGSDEPVYDLTPAVERVLRWMEDLNRSEFVGTESRFLQIFELLQDIVRRSTEDPEVRITELERQTADLEREIAELRTTGRVARYSTTQIKERFIKANEEARRLIGDFSEVEANFREITRTIQERRLLEDATKGDIVGFVLDADESLKESDQGRSFYAFSTGGARSRKSAGYVVELQVHDSRRFGMQTLPARIFFEDPREYAGFLGRRDEVQAFRAAVDATRECVPERVLLGRPRRARLSDPFAPALVRV